MGHLISGNAASFHRDFNRASFAFQHHLQGHELFTLPRLTSTAQAMLAKGAGHFSLYDAQAFRTGTGFGASGKPVPEAIRRLDQAGNWIKLSAPEKADPDYADFLRQVLDELSVMANCDLRSQITWSAITIFLASPHITTPYHIDHESNFLMQVQGEKDVCLFDQNDRDVLPDIEIEQFYKGDPQAARHRPLARNQGTIYRLTPGLGVHHPPLAPHWVQNGGNVSISVGVGFCMRAFDRRAKVYQINGMIRRIGLDPEPPGHSPLRDRIKAAGLELATRRNTTDRDDILFSGIHRLGAPWRLAKRLLRPGRAGSEQ
jgi:hypothetical protein